MSAKLLAAAWDSAPPDPVSLVVLLYLTFRADDNGQRCFPSYKLLCDKTRLSESSVQRAVLALEKGGFLTRERGNGRGKASQYILSTSRIKGMQSDNLNTPKRYSHRPKKVVTRTGAEKVVTQTEKVVTQAKPPHPLIGVNTNKHEKSAPVLGFPDMPAEIPGEKPAAFSLPLWLDEEAWAGFVEMRKRIKKPLTGRALAIAVGKLERWRAEGYDPAAILDEATMNNWQGLWIPKGVLPSKPKARYVPGNPNNPDDWVRASFDPETGKHYDPHTNPPPRLA